MVLTTIYIARHGYRANWLPPPHVPSPTGILSDPPLAPHGVTQAKELADYIKTLDPKPELIFSSPFYRCIETSVPVSEALGLDINLENGIGEWYKPDRSEIPSPASLELLQSLFKTVVLKDTTLITPSIKGENESQIFNRCSKFLSIFLKTINEKQPNIKSILFVTHAASKISLGMALLGKSGVYDKLNNDGEKIKSGTCSLDTFKFNNNDKKWELIVNGETSFLKNGEEMNWYFDNPFEAGSDEDIKWRQETAKNDDKYDQNNTNDDDDDDDDELVETYFTIDIPDTIINNNTLPSNSKESTFKDPTSRLKPKQMINSNSELQISGLESLNPYVRIDDSIYKGEWRRIVGTEVIVDSYGNPIVSLEDKIELTAGSLKKKGDKQAVNLNLLEKIAKLQTN